MQLEFEQPLFLFGLLLLAAAGWGYRHSLADFSRFQRKVSLCIRSLIIILLVLASAGWTLLKPSHEQRFVFVTDQSRSAGQEGITKSNDYHPDDFAAQRVFFGTAAETNIAEGIEKASALVEPQYIAHLVLFTDGNETSGDLLRTADALARSGTAVISTVPLTGSGSPEVQFAEVKLPKETLREGEAFYIEAVVQSNIETNVTVILYRDAFKTAEIKKQLKAGENVVRFRQTATDKKQQEYTLEVTVPDKKADTILENNRLHLAVTSQGKVRVLILDTETAQIRDFAASLKEQDIAADIRPPEGMPRLLSEFEQYDAVILSDVPATALSLQQMNLLRQYVSGLGGGLMMLGGDQSFGLGGYYKTPIEEILPVRCDIPKEKEKPSIAMCLVIDRSGSMGGQKMEWAKDAAKAAVELLSPKDFAAVIAFDNESYIVCPMQSTAAVSAINAAISSIEPAGGTNIYPALA
ncbi:MAG: VWA domain-containing protein, partial [Planctomycetaceae bacterium]|nr:VWA domain-containing protein [Planctomycetaceae bacterium]